MKRLGITVVFSWMLFGMLTSQVMALPQFKKAFEVKYGVKSGQNAELKAAVKKAACNTCHVKGEKKDVQNSYGEALNALIEGSAKARLDAAKEISKEEGKAELDELVEEFTTALGKVEDQESPDGGTFGERIRSGKLPVELPLDEEEGEG